MSPVRPAVPHGGDLAAATARYGAPAGGWVDLSTGINPFPYPVDAADLAALARLPDGAQLARLRDAAADAYGHADRDGIVAAPGTQALIQWLPYLRPPGNVAVISPTYGEHAAAWAAAGHDVAAVPDLAAARGADVAVVTSPNNPDGRIACTDALRTLAAAGTHLVVDGAFADLLPQAPPSVSGAVMLRSFGKFYGLPGLRLGFALTDAETAAALTEALGPWAVSSLAAEVGARALADRDWQAATRTRLKDAASRLDALLAGAGFDIVGGTDLYRLVAHDDAPDILARLGAAGIYVRDFPDSPHRLRFGLPGADAAWARLERTLAS